MLIIGSYDGMVGRRRCDWWFVGKRRKAKLASLARQFNFFGHCPSPQVAICIFFYIQITCMINHCALYKSTQICKILLLGLSFTRIQQHSMHQLFGKQQQSNVFLFFPLPCFCFFCLFTEEDIHQREMRWEMYVCVLVYTVAFYSCRVVILVCFQVNFTKEKYVHRIASKGSLYYTILSALLHTHSCSNNETWWLHSRNNSPCNIYNWMRLRLRFQYTMGWT